MLGSVTGLWYLTKAFATCWKNYVNYSPNRMGLLNIKKLSKVLECAYETPTLHASLSREIYTVKILTFKQQS